MNNKVIILSLIVIIIYYVYKYNKKNNVETADKKQYSDSNNYKYVSHMKHDIFKQITVDIIPVVVLGLITSDEIISFNNFWSSMISKALLSSLGFVLYYQIVQPYIVNSLPNF